MYLLWKGSTKKKKLLNMQSIQLEREIGAEYPTIQFG